MCRSPPPPPGSFGIRQMDMYAKLQTLAGRRIRDNVWACFGVGELGPGGAATGVDRTERIRALHKMLQVGPATLQFISH